MSEARIGWGGELQISTSASPDGLVEIGEVKEFALPSDEADEVEVTHLKSPDRRKEFIAGLIDGGSVEATINYVPGSASDLLLADARDTGTVRAVRFILPDQVGDAAWHITTSGFVKKYAANSVTPGEPIMATLTIRITGESNEGAVTNEDAS